MSRNYFWNMIEMEDLESFMAFVTMVASTGLGVFVRFVSRNDRNRTLVISDLAVGLEILIALIAILGAQSILHLFEKNRPGLDETLVDRVNYEMAVCMLGLIVLIVGLWIVSTIVRKRGWENENELNVVWGVGVPNLISFGAIYYFFTYFNFLYK